MQPRDLILERLEAVVDLAAYLGQRGYRPAGNVSADGIPMANRTTGDVVIIKKEGDDRPWVYSTPGQRTAAGTIADFLARRDGASRDACTSRIAALATLQSQDEEALRYRKFVANCPPDLAAAMLQHFRARDVERAATVALRTLGIAKDSLDEWRFGKLRSPDAVAKLITDPVALWTSRYRPTDRTLVFTEQPIDAIAYERQHGKQMACYMATGGRLEPEIRTRITHVLRELPAGVTVVLAFGNGEQGRKLAAEIQALAPSWTMAREPPAFGARWSNQMQLEQRHARSLARTGHALDR